MIIRMSVSIDKSTVAPCRTLHAKLPYSNHGATSQVGFYTNRVGKFEKMALDKQTNKRTDKTRK
jgi:hypothetical protein